MMPRGYVPHDDSSECLAAVRLRATARDRARPCATVRDRARPCATVPAVARHGTNANAMNARAATRVWHCVALQRHCRRSSTDLAGSEISSAQLRVRRRARPAAEERKRRRARLRAREMHREKREESREQRAESREQRAEGREERTPPLHIGQRRHDAPRASMRARMPWEDAPPVPAALLRALAAPPGATSMATSAAAQPQTRASRSMQFSGALPTPAAVVCGLGSCLGPRSGL